MFPDDDEFEFAGQDRGWNYEPSRAELFKQFRSPVYTTDADGWLTYYNDAAAELWGYRPELGKTRWCGSWRVFTTDGSLLPLDRCPMAVAIREERQVRGVQAVLERPDGTRIPFMPYPTLLRDASGALVGAFNQLVQITHLREPSLPDSVARGWPDSMLAPLHADLTLEDLTRYLQATLSARADVEFEYRMDCERLQDWSGPAAEKQAILCQLEQKRQQQRTALGRRVDRLQDRATEIMARSQPAVVPWMRPTWSQPTMLH